MFPVPAGFAGPFWSLLCLMPVKLLVKLAYFSQPWGWGKSRHCVCERRETGNVWISETGFIVCLIEKWKIVLYAANGFVLPLFSVSVWDIFIIHVIWMYLLNPWLRLHVYMTDWIIQPLVNLAILTGSQTGWIKETPLYRQPGTFTKKPWNKVQATMEPSPSNQELSPGKQKPH